MARIAVVDLVFHWPPIGGSMVNVREVVRRLAKIHEVCLFTPHMNRMFPRGVFKLDPGFQVEAIPCSLAQFNPVQLPKLIKRRVDHFRPDLVWVADGWTMKPYVLESLKQYLLWHSFFAYEMLCPVWNLRFRRGELCPNTVLIKPRQCYYEVARLIAEHLVMMRPDPGIHEALVSGAFLPGYSERVRRALSSCHRHIVYGPHYLELLKDIPALVSQIPGGVDTNHFRPIEQERQGILMVGRVVDPAKGLPVLRKAMDILKDRGISVPVFLTGDVKCEAPFQSIPWSPPSEMPDLYSRALCMVAPSVWEESFGLVAVEAMACGTPVVASDLGGLKTIVEHGETGFLFEPGDHIDLADKLEILLGNPQLRNEMGLAARKAALDRFDWDKIVDNHYAPLVEEDLAHPAGSAAGRRGFAHG